MTSETPQQRMGRLVRAQRKSLKMTQSDVQAAGGPSTATLRLIEGGRHADFRDGTGTDLEKAIRWQPGSIDAILAGGDPTPLRTEEDTFYGFEEMAAKTLRNHGISSAGSITEIADDLAAEADRITRSVGTSYDLKTARTLLYSAAIQMQKSSLRLLVGGLSTSANLPSPDAEKLTEAAQQARNIAKLLDQMSLLSSRLRASIDDYLDPDEIEDESVVIHPAHWNDSPKPPETFDAADAASLGPKQSDDDPNDADTRSPE